MLKGIDEIDKKILLKLQENARAPFSKIAKEVGVSEATVFLRVRRLMKQGVIKGFRTVVAPQLLGKALTAFILVKADPRKYPHVIDIIKQMDAVVEAYDVTGPYYAILKVIVEDKESLAKVIDTIGSIEGVASTETAVVLREIKESPGVKF